MAKLGGVLLLLCSFASVAVIACGGGSSSSQSAPSTGTAQVVELKALENGDAYSFSPATLQVKTGQVLVRYTNQAGNARTHTFEVKTLDGKGNIVKSDEVQAGKTKDVTFALSAPGTYQFLCWQRGHADRGQTGTLVVAGG